MRGIISNYITQQARRTVNRTPLSKCPCGKQSMILHHKSQINPIFCFTFRDTKNINANNNTSATFMVLAKCEPIDPICHYCDQLETNNHIYECVSRSTRTIQSPKQIFFLLDPITYIPIHDLTNGIFQWCYATLVPFKTTAAAAQQHIGWHHGLRGFLCSAWQDLQHSYAHSLPEKQQNMTHLWLSKVIGHLLQLARDLWIFLCHQVHDRI